MSASYSEGDAPRFFAPKILEEISPEVLTLQRQACSVTPMKQHVTIATSTDTWEDAFQIKTGPAAMRPVVNLQRRIATRLGLARPIDLKIIEATHEGRGAVMVTPSGETVTVTPS